MRIRSKILRRINILYILFFVAIVMAFISVISNDMFSVGFQHGYSGTVYGNHIESGIPKKKIYTTLLVDIKNSASAFDYPISVPMKSGNGLASADARIGSLDLALAGEGKSPFVSGWGIAFMVVATICYSAVFIMIFVIITSLRRSIRRQTIIERSTIIRTRIIGILLLCASLANSTIYWIDSRIAASAVDFSQMKGMKIDTSFSFTFQEIITAILIMFIAEVFVISYDLSQEQKLTI